MKKILALLQRALGLDFKARAAMQVERNHVGFLKHRSFLTTADLEHEREEMNKLKFS